MHDLATPPRANDPRRDFPWRPTTSSSASWDACKSRDKHRPIEHTLAHDNVGKLVGIVGDGFRQSQPVRSRHLSNRSGDDGSQP